MSSYILKYHELVTETPKAYLIRFNIQSRIRSEVAICIPLGNSSTYPMWSSQKAFEENSWAFGSEYSKTHNFYEATKAINFDIWLPKSKVKLDTEKRRITIPDWLLKKNSDRPFASKAQVNPEEFKSYPWHSTLYFYQMIRYFFQVKFIGHEVHYGASYGDCPWMENGIGSWSMQD